MMTLITADIGNALLKFRPRGGGWSAEPSLVRPPATRSFNLATDIPIRPLTYISGPARLAQRPYLVGHDAERAGNIDLSRIGSASVRIQSDPYLALHLYAIVASLPADVTEAQIVFAGGLPAEDMDAKDELVGRLKGTHRLLWGEVEYRVVIRNVLIVPQPVAAVCTLLFQTDGRVLANGALTRKRLMLDSGGGTTDYSGRIGLNAVPGTEGGIRVGSVDVAEQARRRIMARLPDLRLDTQTVLAAMRNGSPCVHHKGAPISIAEDIANAADEIAQTILAHVLPIWEPHLTQSEVQIVGGNGSHIAPTMIREIGHLAPVHLLDLPLFRVADGLERLARHKLKLN